MVIVYLRFAIFSMSLNFDCRASVILSALFCFSIAPSCKSQTTANQNVNLDDIFINGAVKQNLAAAQLKYTALDTSVWYNRDSIVVQFFCRCKTRSRSNFDTSNRGKRNTRSHGKSAVDSTITYTITHEPMPRICYYYKVIYVPSTASIVHFSKTHRTLLFYLGRDPETIYLRDKAALILSNYNLY
jgi:hypothetical protein